MPKTKPGCSADGRDRSGSGEHRTRPVACSDDVNVNNAGRVDELARGAERCFLTGRCADGVSLLEEAVVLSERARGEDHPETVQLFRQMAHAYVQVGDLPAAEQLYKRLHRWCTRHKGAEHEETALVTESLAAVLFHQGRFGEASGLQETAVQAYLRLYGESDARTLESTTRFVLCEAHAERQRLQKATLTESGDGTNGDQKE